jgi:inorganic pyrophosphatase
MSANRIMDPIGKLMGLRYKSHPWHGINIGENAPKSLMAFIEMVPTDTVKYEVDKESGYLKIDRPQKYSNVVPSLYGFVPQTYCANLVAEYANEKTNRKDIVGDHDPLDICVLTEKEIVHGDIIVQSKPIGGFRMIDGNEADDKIIAVLEGDAVFDIYNDVSELPQIIVDRLKHYFLTYKDLPGNPSHVEITDTYGREEALEVISRSMKDYRNKLNNLGSLLQNDL